MLMHKYCPNFKNCGQIKKTNDKWNDWYNQHLILSQYAQFSIHILYVGIEHVRLSVISKLSLIDSMKLPLSHVCMSVKSNMSETVFHVSIS